MQALMKTSDNRWYLTTSAILFTVVAIAHLAMIVFQMPGSIGDYVVPYELNGIIVVGLGYLATRGFMAAHRL